MKFLVFVIPFIFISLTSRGQSFEPGESYLDENAYVEYLAGNLPIIISVPHGGYLEPDSIPDRDCDDCLYFRDSYTQELSFGLREAIYDKTGCYPHMVINLLHRKKFDANRSIETAADGNPLVENSWQAYHDFIDSAKTAAVEAYGRALFIDMHGHGHDIERIELGYLFTKTELQLSDEELNTTELINETSIKQLISDNIGELTCSELLRGDQSLGSLLHAQGFPSVPSNAIPAPLGEEPYFSGGYNTIQHGSKYGGFVDAVQLEFHSEVRWDESLRLELADSLATTLIQYINMHYNNEFATYFCSLPDLDIENIAANDLVIYPNPSTGIIKLPKHLNGAFSVYNIKGSIVFYRQINGSSKMDISHLEEGIYFICFTNLVGEPTVCKIIKQ